MISSESIYMIRSDSSRIPVDCDEVGAKFKCFCRQLAERIAGQAHGVKFNSVYNLGRAMLVMGTFKITNLIHIYQQNE